MANLAAAFDVLTTGADKAASDIERVGKASEHTGGKVSKLGSSARLLGSTFVGASNQALGPLQEIADKFDVIERAGEHATSKISGKLLGLGAAGLGAGSFLSTLASREKGAEQQLHAAIEATGKSYEDFEGQIASAIRSGEHFGSQASTTMDALNRLTLTTHNPTLALKDLAYAQDVAAAKHVPLQKAAEIVGLVFNGSTRAGKQFGLQLESTTGAVAALTTAQHAAVSASDRVKTAQQTYNDKLAVYNQTLKPTLAQQIALFRSHQDVAKAQDAAAKAAARLKTAQDKATAAAGAGQRNVDKLRILHGQAAGAADTFSGHLRALGARIEDTAGKAGEKYGTAINTISLGTIAVGTLIETGLFPKLGGLVRKLGTTGKAFEVLRDVEIVSSAEGAAGIQAAVVKNEAALAEQDAAVVASTGKVKGLFGMLSGLGLTAGIVLAGVGVAIDEAMNRRSLDKGLKGTVEELKLAETTAKTAADFLTAQAAAVDAARGLGVTAGKAAGTFVFDPKANSDKVAAGIQILTDAGRANFGGLGGGSASDRDIERQFQKGVLPGTSSAAAAAGGKKVGKAAGDATLQAFLDAIGGGKAANAVVAQAAAEAAKAAKQAAIDTATAMRDAVKDQFDQAKSVLRDVLAQSLQLRQSISSALVQGAQITDVFGTGPNLNANHAFGKGQDFNSVKRFFEDRLRRLRRFAAELSALVHKGLDPAVVAQIAQAGVDQGGRLADALSGSSKAQLGEVNRLNRGITQIADSAGKRVADVQFKAQIASDKKNTELLGKKLDLANRHLSAISGKKISLVDQAAQAFLLGA